MSETDASPAPGTVERSATQPGQTPLTGDALTPAGPAGRAGRLRAALREHESDRVERVEAALGRTIAGRFEPIREIGRGGMGVVIEARDATLDRTVAVKVLLAGDLASEAARERFRTEARAAARLRHRNVVTVHEVGEDDEGRAFLVMDLVEGESVATRLGRDGPLPPREAARIAAAVATGLAYAHGRFILHRDVKPQNVLLDADGEALLTDFGLAKEIGEAAATGPTASGHAIGTPGFMPPEQAAGDLERIDRRADVWGVGATLYAMLLGHAPFEGASAAEVIFRVLREAPTPPSRERPEIDRDLETICLRCLEKEPDARYGSAGELAADLQRWLDHRPIVARPPGLAERSSKWLRRNAGLARTIAGATLLAGLVLAVVVVVFLARLAVQRDRARDAAIEAERQRDLARDAETESSLQAERARKRAEVAQRALELVILELDDTLSTLPGDRIRRARSRLLTSAAEQLEALEALDTEDEASPRLSRLSSTTWTTIGYLALIDREPERAVAASSRAVEISRAILAEEPDADTRRALATELVQLGLAHLAAKDGERARAAWAEAVEIARAHRDADPRLHGVLLRALVHAATEAAAHDDHDESRRLSQEAEEAGRRLTESRPDEAPPREMLVLYSRQAHVARRAGDRRAAREVLERYVVVARARRATAKDTDEADEDLVWGLFELANEAEAADDPGTTQRSLEELVQIGRARLQADPSSGELRVNLSNAFGRLGILAEKRGDLVEAASMLEAGAEVLRHLARIIPDDPRAHRALLDLLAERVRVARDVGDGEGYAKLVTEGAHHCRRLVELADPLDANDIFALDHWSLRLADLADLRFGSGDRASAIALLREALEIEKVLLTTADPRVDRERADRIRATIRSIEAGRSPGSGGD